MPDTRIASVHENASLSRFEHAIDQLEHGALARAAASDERDRFVAMHLKRHIA